MTAPLARRRPRRRDPRAAYAEVVREARATGYRLAADAQDRLQRAFHEAARRIEFDLSRATDPITRARARELQREISALILDLEDASTSITARAAGLTAREVAEMHEEVVTDLLTGQGKRVPRGVGAAFDRLQSRAAAILAAEERASTFRTLVNRNIEEAAPALDTLITAAVAQGISPRTLTRDIAALIAGAEGRSLADYGLGSGDVSGLRTLLSDSRRIATTETLNALRSAQTDSLDASRLVAAVKWQVSGAHPREDECDVLAEADLYDFGPGFYPPDRFPEAPHPYCACTQGELQFRPPEEWGRPREPGEPLDAAEVELPEGWSEARRARALRSLRDATGLAPLAASTYQEEAASVFGPGLAAPAKRPRRVKHPPPEGYLERSAEAMPALDDARITAARTTNQLAKALCDVIPEGDRMPYRSVRFKDFGDRRVWGVNSNGTISLDGKEVRQGLRDLLRGERTPEGYLAVQVTLHERLHSMSPKYEDEYLNPYGRAIEEGLVERQARLLTRKAWQGDIPAGAERLANSYDEWVRAMDEVERAVPGTLDKVWHKRRAAERAEILGEGVREWLDKEMVGGLEKAGLPEASVADLRSQVKELDTKALMTFWERDIEIQSAELSAALDEGREAAKPVGEWLLKRLKQISKGTALR